MTYIYRQINEHAFIDAFRDMGRNEQFSYEGKKALFEYLEQLAEDMGEPIELDVIALCCDYSDYATIEEYNHEYGTEFEDWDAVAQETTVILVPNTQGAIVQAH